MRDPNRIGGIIGCRSTREPERRPQQTYPARPDGPVQITSAAATRHCRHVHVRPLRCQLQHRPRLTRQCAAIDENPDGLVHRGRPAHIDSQLRPPISWLR